MENKEKNQKAEDVMSRRQFFKKAASKALPIFGFMVLGSAILSSCEEVPSYCSSCSGTCSGYCDSSCSGYQR